MRVEDTLHGEGRQVLILCEVPPFYDLRLAGEDLRQGDLILRKGDLLRSAEIGLLASLGRSTIQIYQRAQIAILSTGDELLHIDEPLQPGKIYNSNSYSLAALVLDAGAIPIQLGIARDTREDLEEKFLAGARADLIISSGGVSVGDYDLVKRNAQKKRFANAILESLHETRETAGFWRNCWQTNLWSARQSGFVHGVIRNFVRPASSR